MMESTCTRAGRIFLAALTTAAVLGAGCVPFWQQEEVKTGRGSGAEAETSQAKGELIRFQNYSSLTELVTIICDDAGKQFNGFFGPFVVMVQPFQHHTEFGGKKKTALGSALSDQMIAMINNNAIDESQPGNYPQELNGSLQEMDGFLRVHISGVNSLAKRRSYAVNIEMSESLYRALHGTIDSK